LRILVFGAGAIGSVFGGFLAMAGHQVTLVGRGWHMDAIREKGIHVSGIWGKHSISDVKANSSLPEGNNYELVLLTVKSYQTRAAVRELDHRLRDPIPVLSLQNGLGNLETISEMIGPNRTLGGRVIFGAEIKGPGEVMVTVYADRVAVGPMKGSGFPFERMEEIAAMIHACGIPCIATREIERFIWGKVLYNVALNAPAAILEINYGRLLEQESTRELMKGIVQEAFTVARTMDVDLDWTAPEEYIEVLFQKLIPPTALHFPSMLQDIHGGKKTEIDALNGALVRLGQAHGLSTPINETLSALIRFKEAKSMNSHGSPDFQTIPH